MVREKLITELEQTFRKMLRSYRKEMANLFDSELTTSEFMFLQYLSAHGPTKVSILADEFQVNRSHVSNVMDRLYSRRLIDRIHSVVDRRIVEVFITEDGTELFNVMKQKRSKYFKRRFEHLNDEEINQMVHFFKKMKRV
ncbi:MarR family winged helix-turn-helix transcriptional regulator [Alkalihalobacillus sp. AL-G]|uniref:MarR family winged helix-turn-helix transcriptional regulator n=1 Tax=Alkalihalobacillus sp. AL-G TaxID=2926399 RepID=UPI00272ABA93|nr:MarR family transcriptional regulator [Alkalihalobacillus sp. AL-G]WLD94267.1 MarR family transcriptional regulator [Alkalihalobacillus sp. AL-G]